MGADLTSWLGAGIYLLEAWILFLGFRLFFRLAGWSRRSRNIAYAIAAYPGFFGAATEWITTSAPLPALLGAPMCLVSLPGDNTIGWTPAPLISVAIIGSVPWKAASGLYIFEALSFLSWITICILLFRSLAKEERKHASQPPGRGTHAP